MGSVKQFFHVLRHLAYNFAVTEDHLKQMNQRIEALENPSPDYISRLTDRFLMDDEALQRVKMNLSNHTALWGPESRLHIAENASVDTCFFNTNSGSITIGEYSFAGSGVSLLAGSHDPDLTGFLRRDAELQEGCDIWVGKGVWLASNCTILGPCRIEDNSVIAAGAVVVPGTVVSANTVYGGVPAKKIRSLCLESGLTLSNPAVKKAFERSGGVLFVEGWSEKKIYPGLPVIGHFLTGKGLIFVQEPNWVLYYGLNNGENGRLIFRGILTLKETVVECDGKQGRQIISLPCSGEKPEPVEVEFSSGNARIFLMLSALTEEDRKKAELNGKHPGKR